MVLLSQLVVLALHVLLAHLHRGGAIPSQTDMATSSTTATTTTTTTTTTSTLVKSTCDKQIRSTLDCGDPGITCTDGDPMIAIIASLHKNNETSGRWCDQLIPQVVEEVVAVRWLLKKLEETNYLPGISIGKTFPVNNIFP